MPSDRKFAAQFRVISPADESVQASARLTEAALEALRDVAWPGKLVKKRRRMLKACCSLNGNAEVQSSSARPFCLGMRLGIRAVGNRRSSRMDQISTCTTVASDNPRNDQHRDTIRSLPAPFAAATAAIGLESQVQPAAG